MDETARPNRVELERALRELGLQPSSYRALMALPLVHVAWADGKMDQVEIDRIRDLSRHRLHLTAEGALVLKRWLEERPSREYVERGLKCLLHLALSEEMVEVDAADLPDLVFYAEAIAAATADAHHDPTSVTPEEEDALLEIARLLEVDGGATWKHVLDALRTQRPPA